MKTKNFMQRIGACITFIALIMLVIIGCSKDNTDDDSDAFTAGHIWPAGDYPSLVAPDFNDSPVIGLPILTLTAKHVGDFSPKIKAIEGENWKGDITRIEGWYCNDEKVSFDFSPDKLWSSGLPIRNYYFDYVFPELCDDSELKNYDISWPETSPKRFKLMEYGNWITDEMVVKNDDYVGDYHYRITRKFNQIIPQPELYMSLHRDWIYESGTDVVQSGEGNREIITYSKTGVVETQMTKITETLELGAEASYGGVSASINQTFSNESTDQIEFSQIDSKEIKEYYMIPANETWRFITLYGVERYSFTDSNGNEWVSPNLVTDELGFIEDHVRTFVMIVKYKSTSVSAFASELIEIKNPK